MKNMKLFNILNKLQHRFNMADIDAAQPSKHWPEHTGWLLSGKHLPLVLEFPGLIPAHSEENFGV